MAGHDVPPDDQGNGTPAQTPRAARPPSAAPATNIPRPAPRAPAAPRPSQIAMPPPRPSTLPPRSTPTGTTPPGKSPSQPSSPPPSGPPKNPNAELQVGQMFAGRYRIERQVGKGGMGAVYLATQEPLARMVAIKVLHGTADDTTVARFQREARLIAQLQHPHIVGLIDFGEDYGRLYLVMEYIDGESLTGVLSHEGPFDPQRVVDTGLQIAEALAVAHDMSVVHRDVKPDNIMLLRTAGGNDFVKMLDFGVAKIKRDGEANQQNTIETKAGLIVGSLRYISPEQVENGEITTRTDMYSYGCVLYEMLAGRRVFEYPSPADCAIAHITETPKPPEVDGQRLSGPLVDFIMRCLEKKADKRPANAREAIAALSKCRQQPLLHQPQNAARTMQQVTQGLDHAQAASTMEVQQVPRAPRPPDAPVLRPEARRLDAPIRQRPSGAHSFAIVGAEGGNTSTHFSGVRLQPQALPPEAGSRWWLWGLVGLVAVGIAVAIVVILTSGPSTRAPEVPVEAAGGDAAVPTAADAVVAEVVAAPETKAEDASALAASAADAASVIPPSAADAATGAPDAGPGDAGADGVVAAEKPAGASVVTDPPGATVSIDKKAICKTPCVVPWTVEETPPLVRVSLVGYIDIDLQFVKGDRGTEQKLTLRPKP